MDETAMAADAVDESRVPWPELFKFIDELEALCAARGVMPSIVDQPAEPVFTRYSKERFAEEWREAENWTEIS